MLTTIPNDDHKYNAIRAAKQASHTLVIRRRGRGVGPDDWTVVRSLRIWCNPSGRGVRAVLDSGRIEARSCHWAVQDGDEGCTPLAANGGEDSSESSPQPAASDSPVIQGLGILRACPTCHRKFSPCPHCGREQYCLHCLWCLHCKRGKAAGNGHHDGESISGLSKHYTLADIERRARSMYAEVRADAYKHGRLLPSVYLGALVHVSDNGTGRRLSVVCRYLSSTGVPRKVEEEL